MLIIIILIILHDCIIVIIAIREVSTLTPPVVHGMDWYAVWERHSPRLQVRCSWSQQDESFGSAVESLHVPHDATTGDNQHTGSKSNCGSCNCVIRLLGRSSTVQHDRPCGREKVPRAILRMLSPHMFVLIVKEQKFAFWRAPSVCLLRANLSAVKYTPWKSYVCREGRTYFNGIAGLNSSTEWEGVYERRVDESFKRRWCLPIWTCSDLAFAWIPRNTLKDIGSSTEIWTSYSRIYKSV